MARDRTARRRIRRHLAAHGPVVDRAGLATKTLKESVGYAGSPVAFIQLLAAMERDGELCREVRGKRTYRIALAPLASSAPHAAPASESEKPITERRGADSEPVVDEVRIDYEALARAVLRELISPSLPALVQHYSADHDKIVEERDAYAAQLAVARAKLEELRRRGGTSGSRTTEPAQTSAER